MNVAARQMRWEPLTQGLLPLASGAPWLQRLNLGGNRRQVAVQRLVQQALLLGAEPLTLRDELQPLEDGVLMRELLDDGLSNAASARADRRASRSCWVFECVEVVGNHEW